MPRRRGKYYLEDASYLPEMITTPRGTTYLTDELGNPAISLGALRDIGGNPKIYSNKELSDNQPTYGITNKQASKLADLVAGATAPGIGDLLMAGIGKPMNLTSPSHWWGAIRDWDTKKGWRNIWEDNSGVLTKQYAEQHPWQALGANLLTDGIITGGLNGVKNSIRIANNIKNRNLFSYKYLDPAGYDNLYPRIKNWAYHIIHDPNFKKGEIPEPVEVVFSDSRKRELFKRRKDFATFRDESFRKYLGLPEREGIYVDNGDGTWRYNQSVVKRILERNGRLGNTIEKPSHSINYDAEKPYTANDFITSSGGNVAIIPKSRTKLTDTLSEQIDEMYDTWDVTPGASYNKVNNGLSGFISDYIRNKADDVYTSLYDKVYKNKFGYNYLGGKALNNIRYGFDLKNYPKINKVIEKIGNKEVGFILGGKPFTMRTPMRYYINRPIPPKSNDIDVIRRYYRSLPDIIPLEFTYKYGGKIHIKEKNRGKFNALKKRTGKTTEELTHSKNPLTRKRAIFAQNAAKWKH